MNPKPGVQPGAAQQSPRWRLRGGRRARLVPADDRTCGWSEVLPSPRPARPLAEDRRVECAVVGAGYTGLAIARRLAESRPEWRVLLLDAQRVADGTSGRNSGFIVDLTDVAGRMTPPVRAGYVAVARSGIEHLRALVAEHGIRCDWDETGWIRAYAGAAGERALAPFPALYEELGIEYLRLGREAMADITGTSFYRGGIRLPGYPLINGAALARGLAGVLPEQVELRERSPVRRIVEGSTVRVEVGDGAVVETDRLFLATNAYTPFLGYLARRVFPLYTFGSLTRLLGAEEQARLGGEREWGILAMDPMGSSVRRTRDQRILVRNTVHYARDLKLSEAVRERMRGENRKAFLARFPALEEVEFEYSWAGLLGSTYNSQIHFGPVGRNVWATAGFTGAGIALGSAAGRLLVDLALGEPSPMVAALRALPPPTWMPPEPFRSVGGGWLAERMNRKAEPETL